MNPEYKKCPRCGTKLHKTAKICSACDLHFDRINNLSNKSAKMAIKKKEKEKVLYVRERPQDVDAKKFWLLYIFLGWLGAYNIYIGKYKKGFYSLITFSFFIVVFTLSQILEANGVDVQSLYYYVVNPSITFAVFGLLIWFIDLSEFTTKTFKYPAAMPEDEYLKIVLKSDRFSYKTETKDEVKEENNEKE